MASDEELRAVAQQILARDEFARWHADFEAWLRGLERLIEAIPSGLIDALRWLQETLLEGVFSPLATQLDRLLAELGIFGASPQAFGWMAVCLLLSGGLVLAYRFRSAGRAKARTQKPQLEPSWSHREAIALADGLAEQGRTLEAAHRIQIATLALLIELDWLELARSDPNRTLRRRVAESALPARERRQLIALVDRLESLWFGEPREDRALYDDWRALDDRVVLLATGSGP